MAEIVNLRRSRKAKARSRHEKRAAANRLAFGRTKVEKIAGKIEHERADRRLRSHLREVDEDKSSE